MTEQKAGKPTNSVAQLFVKVSFLCRWSRDYETHNHEIAIEGPILRQLEEVHTLMPVLLNIYFNIIFPAIPKSSIKFLPLKVSH